MGESYNLSSYFSLPCPYARNFKYFCFRYIGTRVHCSSCRSRDTVGGCRQYAEQKFCVTLSVYRIASRPFTGGSADGSSRNGTVRNSRHLSCVAFFRRYIISSDVRCFWGRGGPVENPRTA